MFEVNISLFREGANEREYVAFFLVGLFPTHRTAENFVRALAANCRYELEKMLLYNDTQLDGLCIDIREYCGEPKTFDTSYELIPGRTITVWHDEECHE